MMIEQICTILSIIDILTVVSHTTFVMRNKRTIEMNARILDTSVSLCGRRARVDSICSNRKVCADATNETQKP